MLIWSTSFITARIGLADVSPLQFVAVRQAAVAVILTGAMLALRADWRPLAGRWHHCAIAGVLINAVTMMTAHVGMVTVGAAPMALMGALNPLLTAALAAPLLGERMAPRQWLGLVTGCAGVVIVVGVGAAHSPAERDGLLLGGCGVIGLCLGTLHFARTCRDLPLLAGATVQFIAAALVTGAGALLLETPHGTWTSAAIGVTVWNVLGVSIGGMALYYAMLRRGAAGQVAANFYLVPGTVAVMGWLLLGERLPPLAILGLAVASLGVWLVRRRG